MLGCVWVVRRLVGSAEIAAARKAVTDPQIDSRGQAEVSAADARREGVQGGVARPVGVGIGAIACRVLLGIIIGRRPRHPARLEVVIGHELPQLHENIGCSLRRRGVARVGVVDVAVRTRGS